jgi:murein DD-endopeptidase MepM/ murein hydrolase activator NlpD
MAIAAREIYASSNGHRWFVGTDSETGRVFIKHAANIRLVVTRRFLTSTL